MRIKFILTNHYQGKSKTKFTYGEINLDEAVQVLERTPATLSGLLESMSSAWLDNQEVPESWSLLTVLIHFIHNERTNWIPRARIILSEIAGL